MEKRYTSRELDYYDIGIMPYAEAWDLQRDIFSRRKEGIINDSLLLLEHPHTYTLGKVAKREHLLMTEEELRNGHISVFDIDRGGDITYHGPGQIVGYPIINLSEWQKDSHKYLRTLEQVLIDMLHTYGIESGRKEGLTGVWIEDRKIAAIGIKISSWITMHGFALNVNTDMHLFQGIVPCGITDKKVTSLQQEKGAYISLEEVKERIVKEFVKHFNYDQCKKNVHPTEISAG